MRVKSNSEKNKGVLDVEEIKSYIQILLKKYNAEYAVLFGSYARNEADNDSDIDVVVYGGNNFKPENIFAFGEELWEMSNKDVDCFEINEVKKESNLYRDILKEGIKIE